MTEGLSRRKRKIYPSQMTLPRNAVVSDPRLFRAYFLTRQRPSSFIDDLDRNVNHAN